MIFDIYGVISEGVFNLVPFSKKDEPNHCLSSLFFRLKSWGTVIWLILLRIGQNCKYLPRLPHLYLTKFLAGNLFGWTILCEFWTCLHLLNKGYNLKVFAWYEHSSNLQYRRCDSKLWLKSTSLYFIGLLRVFWNDISNLHKLL